MISSVNQTAGANNFKRVAVSQNAHQFYQTASKWKTNILQITQKSTAIVMHEGVLLTFMLGMAVSGAMLVSQASHSHKMHTSATATVTTEYVVQPGDTLWKIAMIKGRTGNMYDIIQEIESVNQLNDNSNIYPGQVLRIPNGRS
jgi:nucleoid-associated protein YgaU